MESHYGTGNCSYDYLAVTEGGGASLWRGCGEEIPATISSISDTVRVHFQSDYSVAHNGFRLGRTANIHVILIEGSKMSILNNFIFVYSYFLRFLNDFDVDLIHFQNGLLMGVAGS